MIGRILILSADFPPAGGGVADHTLQLARELSTYASVSVLTSAGLQPYPTNYPVQARVGSWQELNALSVLIQQSAPEATLLWQYVPHMYGRGGVNSALPRLMARLKATGRQQLVIAHEIAAPISFWPHRLRYSVAHRHQWRQILKSADAVGISTEAWLDEWSHRMPEHASKLFLAPSPSNIPFLPVAADHRALWRSQRGLPAEAMILAYFGTLGNRHLDWVFETWLRAQRRDRPVALVFIGGSPEYPVPNRFRCLFRSLGYLPRDQVSFALQAADVLALPFTDGVSERRTSFMSGLHHGVATLTTIGHNTGRILQQGKFFAAVPATDPAAFLQRALKLFDDTGLRATMGTVGKDTYYECYDWPVLARAIWSRLTQLQS
jgi:glycosyltransferase involved in cell wall biosynthesis